MRCLPFYLCSLEPGGAGGGEPPPSFLLTQSEETEPRVSELELEPPNWRELVPPDTLLRLKKSEVKRQEVINGMCGDPSAGFTPHWGQGGCEDYTSEKRGWKKCRESQIWAHQMFVDYSSHQS